MYTLLIATTTTRAEEAAAAEAHQSQNYEGVPSMHRLCACCFVDDENGGSLQLKVLFTPIPPDAFATLPV